MRKKKLKCISNEAFKEAFKRGRAEAFRLWGFLRKTGIGPKAGHCIWDAVTDSVRF
jgi:hypothetical protein